MPSEKETLFMPPSRAVQDPPALSKLPQDNRDRKITKKWTPSFRPLGAESKMDFAGLLSFVFLSVCRSLCALKPFGKERTSGVLHSPSSLSLFLGFPTLPPQAV
jgi:hypothetical protein